MAINVTAGQNELVNALASTIQGKIILPAEEKAAALNYALIELNERIDYLEKRLSALSAAHSRTKVIAAISVLGLTVLAAVQITFFIK